MPLLKEHPVAKKKNGSRHDADDNLTERVIFLASPTFTERLEEARLKLGLSAAAFIRMSCEKEIRRLEGNPDGD